jgi:hypothetical protein
MGDSELERLERDVYRSRWDDGLLDVLFGLVVVAWGLGLALSFVVLGAIAAAVAVAMWAPLSRLVSQPRTGWAELSDARQTLETGKLIVVVVLGIGLFGAVALASDRSTAPVLDLLAPGLVGLLLALPALLAAAATGVPRFWSYGVLLVVAAALGVLGLLAPPTYAVAAGVLITALGARQLAGFVRTQPIREG